MFLSLSRLFSLYFLFICIPLFSENKVQLISNFAVDSAALNETLAQYSPNFTLEVGNLNDYSDVLKQKKSRFLKFIHRFHFGSIPLKKDVSKIVFWNVDSHCLHHFNLSKFSKEKLILFMWEPPLILEKMYDKKVTALFSKIYTWNDDLVDNKTYFKFYYPALQPMIEQIPSFEEKKLCTMVVSNFTSNKPNELYSERNKVIEYFASTGEKDFEFYGRGWDAALYPNYRGAVADKINVQKNYRFIICYENTKNIPGYLSEKIFDCFRSGCVPIYWGASNVEKYIPKDCFVDRRDFSSMRELHTYIKNIGKEAYDGYINRIRAFLASEQAQLFTYENFLRILKEAIEEKS